MNNIYTKHLKHDEIQIYKDAVSLLEMMVLIDTCNITNELNEGVLDSVKSIGKAIAKTFDKQIKPGANKLGVNIGTQKGLLQYIGSISLNTAKMLYYAVDYYYNKNNESKEKIKELAKSVTKEQIIDFLLKLDVLTLHMLTEPIHVIDALTGMHIGANIKKAGQDITQRAHEAITSIEDLKNHLEGKLKSQLQKYANALRRIFGVGEFKKVSEETITTDIEEPDIRIGDTARKRLKDKTCKRRRRACAKSKNSKFLCYDDVINALNKE